MNLRLKIKDMKQVLLLLLLSCYQIKAGAQIYNQDFEQWDTLVTFVDVSYVIPVDWQSNGYIDMYGGYHTGVNRIGTEGDFACEIRSDLRLSDHARGSAVLFQKIKTQWVDQLEFEYNVKRIQGYGKFIFAIQSGADTLYSMQVDTTTNQFVNVAIEMEDEWIDSADSLLISFMAQGVTYLGVTDTSEINLCVVEINNCATNVTVNGDDLDSHQTIVFPNPATDQIVIASDDQIQKVKFYDVQGNQLVISHESKIVSVADLPRGLVLMQIEYTDQRSVIHKILLE